MPTYEYKCGECGHCFDVFHGVNETVESCEICGGSVRRVFHPVGIIFKGSGFYKTDSREAGGNGKKPVSTPAEAKKDESVSAGSASGTEETVSQSSGTTQKS